MPSEHDPHYQAPGWFTRHVFNPLVKLLTRCGISVVGSRELPVRGRQTGEWRTTPAPRGHTQWVSNLRAAGNGELLVGRHVETFEATAINDDDKPVILRAYLRRWNVEVGVFFGGVDANSSDAHRRRIAPESRLSTLDASRAPGLRAVDLRRSAGSGWRTTAAGRGRPASSPQA
jgi:hypothetical protein